MLKKLLLLSLIVIPFYEVILYFLIPSRNYPSFVDMRVTKDFMASLFAIAIGAGVLSTNGFKKITNIWIPIFLLFIVFNIYKAPATSLHYDGIWNYQPAYQMFVYYFLFLGVKNMTLTKQDIQSIYKTIFYCGFAMSILMMIQRLGLDQIFIVQLQSASDATKLPQMGGSLGQATLSSPFIVMCLPFAIEQRKWLIGAFMAIVVILSGSSFAMAGLCAIIIMTIILKTKHKVVYLCSLALTLGTFIYFNQDFLCANGRFAVWNLVVKDIFNGKIAFTGAGIGAFKYLFAMKNGNTWHHAHNEYLQLLWSCGIIGFGIVAMITKHIIKEISISKTILISILGISIISFGTFPLQLAVYQYYLAVMIGVAYSFGGINDFRV